MKVKCDKEGIKLAHTALERGEIIIFPTDTVYGIGCDPFNEKAVEKIFKIKSRDKTKSLPVLVYSMDIASTIVEFDVNSEKLAKKFWPGPLTLILKLKDKKLKKSLCLEKKIALRVPDNNCTLGLLKICKFLIGTSANISGQKPFTNSLECYENFKNVDLFLDGGNLSGTPSTIVEFVNGELKIQREGILKKDEVLKYI